MNGQGSNSNDLPDRLPAAVLARLAAAERPAVPADEDADAAVLAAARAHFAAAAGKADGRDARSRRRGRAWMRSPITAPAARARPARRKRWAAGIAAAAVVLAAFFAVRPLDRFPGYDPDDIDRSGRVDILDAFALARMRADGAPIGDARIDEIAARAVALEPRGAAR